MRSSRVLKVSSTMRPAGIVSSSGQGVKRAVAAFHRRLGLASTVRVISCIFWAKMMPSYSAGWESQSQKCHNSCERVRYLRAAVEAIQLIADTWLPAPAPAPRLMRVAFALVARRVGRV